MFSWLVVEIQEEVEGPGANPLSCHYTIKQPETGRKLLHYNSATTSIATQV